MAADAEKHLATGMDGYVSEPIRITSLRVKLGQLTKLAKQKEKQTVKEPVKDSSNSTFDLEELLARVDNDRELLQDLLSIFKEEFPRHLKGLRDAVVSKDAKLVATTAHTLNGMLLNLAAGETAAAVARIEQLGRSGDLSGLAEAFALFEAGAQRLLPQLEAYLAEVHG